jgi:putative phosphoserine phosphatase / 1-acylglycerol-3-phosphate O-acyltransferase
VNVVGPVVFAAKAAAGAVLVTLFAAAMLIAQVSSLFHARRFCAEFLGRALGRSLLALFGIRVQAPPPSALPPGQVVYTVNHSSAVDMFVLTALGLPNARFFIKRGAWKFPQLGLVAWLMGAFFTVPQRFPQRRTRIFQRADRVLRRTGESVLLSPEGTRVTTGEVGAFNKGAFHLATSLGAPIQPLFIEIPPGMTNGKRYDAQPGLVRVHLIPMIRTEQWRLEDVVANKEQVRTRYVEFLARLRSGRRAA